MPTGNYLMNSDGNFQIWTQKEMPTLYQCSLLLLNARPASSSRKPRLRYPSNTHSLPTFHLHARKLWLISAD